MLRIPYSAMWITIFLVACISVAAGGTSDLIGRRCCEENQVLRSRVCVPSSNATSFSPPFYANLSQPLQSLSWQFQPLECSHEIKHIPLDGEKNSLEIEEGAIFFKRSPDFCVSLDASEEDLYYAAICLPPVDKLCMEHICVQKCCDEGEVLSAKQRNCSKRNGIEFPPDFRALNGSKLEAPTNLFVIDGFPDCDHWAMVMKFHLLQDGRLYEPHNNLQHPRGRYCIDYIVENQTDFAFVCREAISRALQITKMVETAGFLISMVFLSLAIVLHLAIPTLRDMQSLCLVCHMFSLLVVDTVLFTSFSFTINPRSKHCIANAFILHFFFLSTFFWLNVMCYDIWRVIKATVNLVPLVRILAEDKKRFKLYCVYAWGVPTLVEIGTAVMHFLPDDLLHGTVVRPGFGEKRCWFIDDLSALVYFYGFVGFLFLVNLVFLSHTCVMTVRAGSACACFEEVTLTAFNRNHLDVFWQRFSMFCLMALCWVTEIPSWRIHPLEIWIPTDILNSLQGFFVFIIFMCSKKKREVVLQMLRDIKTKVSACHMIEEQVN